MIILAIKTDQENAEISLLNDTDKLSEIQWLAHRELSNTIFNKIDEILSTSNRQLKDIEGIVGYQGPGSFTGLRIGLTTANTLAYALEIPIVASQGDLWLQNGIQSLLNGDNQRVVLPFYGSEAHITKPKK